MISPNVCAISTDRRSLLSEWTTLGVGGPADVMAFPRTAGEAAALLAHCTATGTPWRALGQGSNLLVCDAGVRGVVVHTGGLRGLAFDDVPGDDGRVRVRAGAGVATSALLRRAADRGLGGLECVVGYPASVGGAVRMNAGGRWGETRAVVESVVVADASGDLSTMTAAECAFGYRTSALGRRLVVEVVLRLPRTDPRAFRERVRSIQREKASVQPLGAHSAGCFFRNPPGASAGRLIDEAGLKGRAVGGAMVSAVHANFLVNRGGARGEDFLRLIDVVQEEVRRACGAELVLEVEVWGPEAVPAHA